MTRRRVLFVLTSHPTLGNTGQPTGFHVGETAAPWRSLQSAGIHVDFASPQGGHPPPIGQDPTHADLLATPALHNTIPIAEAEPTYDAIYFVGGHGAMWDFPTNPAIHSLTREIYERPGIIAAICHGQAALINVTLTTGPHLVTGKRLTSFSHTAEHHRGLTTVVPFSLQHTLESRGAHYSSAPDNHPHLIQDGRLITAQNPASAPLLATTLTAAVIELNG
ncbi:type 1 glutamine amidotransferase domain-containing protein [Actinokineospora inagensis]|uniref:type 1 glutamine amidotransferase domain-containing protein n=1 Tax=Actinokineospora inagensis TaxID=103730 RepID=UPI00040F4605|nr:type 1 glutamine amidotransferase domain-containing protein [Actinokineospora inagensis]